MRVHWTWRVSGARWLLGMLLPVMAIREGERIESANLSLAAGHSTRYVGGAVLPVKLFDFEAITTVLRDAEVHFLIVGGMAVNAHGYIRLTLNVDLFIAPDLENIRRAFRGLAELGFRPIAPVSAEDFADLVQRERWRSDRGTPLLRFRSEEFPFISVTLLVDEPFDFVHECQEALIAEIQPGFELRFVSIPTLIQMKQVAGRNRDADDIQHLRWLLQDQSATNVHDADVDWSQTTWDGSRREQLRHTRTLTVRERLEALDKLAELSERLQGMPVSGRVSSERYAMQTTGE